MQFALGFLSALLVLFLAFALRVRRWRRRRRAGLGPAAGGRWAFRGLFARLGTSPSQEQVLLAELEGLRQAARALRDDLAGVRGPLAELVAGADLDAARVEALLAAREARLAELRHLAAAALARFHAVLDAPQRGALAELVRQGHPLAFAGHRRC